VPTLLLKRISTAIPALFGVSIVIFLLINVLPGDPLAGLLAPDASAADRQLMAQQLGLTGPLPVRYIHWLGNVLHGNLGYSFTRQRPVVELIRAAYFNTMLLAAVAAVIGLVSGIVLGTLAALARGSWFDRLISLLAITGLSIPSYWIAVLLIIVFSVRLQWLPPAGTSLQSGNFADFLRHIIMPATAASAVTIGMTARMTRSSLVQIFGEDFVLTLRAKGLTRRQVLAHVWKNAAPPILTVVGLQIGYLLGGSVLVETIFSWPGLGQLVYQSIETRDLRAIQASVLVISVTFVVVNLVIDVIQIVVNPRLRKAS
jgi:peptide/nickel transport system permease protein